ncbi:calcium/calmodulin-dependent protein kinase type IV-like isoform X1 [Rhopilema esculentum]|uniref:calcium/calmodulin-dependent protein kinase type IV-like isoform X1 n=1 Tax=Rhopilema esculentum TaxID=499914 RepID=UPI0031DD6C95
MDTIIFQTEPLEDFYELKEELGRGNFAVVKRCEKKETSEEYAAKCITKKRSKASKRGMSKEAVEIEAGLLLALDHEAIIKLYDVFETKTNITLIMELLTGGELFEEIAKEEFILEKDACHYTKQVLNAIQHMHERNIVHLDLKPENIVLQYPGSKTIKLIDFGLAKMIEPGKKIREMMGTPEFAAPEVIHYDIVGFYTDMWALGVVTYILLSGASPFLGDDDQETYKNISSCEYQFDDEYFDEITKNAKDFIEKLLVKNPKDRNTVQDSLNHPWIALEKDENSVIDTQKMRAFVARRRWKQSLKLVSTISRLKILCRNNTPSPTSDVSGDEGESSNENGGTKPSLRNLINAANENLPMFINHVDVNKHVADDQAEAKEPVSKCVDSSKQEDGLGSDEADVDNGLLKSSEPEVVVKSQPLDDSPSLGSQSEDDVLLIDGLDQLSIDAIETDAVDSVERVTVAGQSNTEPVSFGSPNVKRYVGEAVTIRGNFGQGSGNVDSAGLVTFSIPFVDDDNLKSNEDGNQKEESIGDHHNSESRTDSSKRFEESYILETPCTDNIPSQKRAPGTETIVKIGFPTTISLDSYGLSEQELPPQTNLKGPSLTLQESKNNVAKNNVAVKEIKVDDIQSASKFTVTIPKPVAVCNKSEEVTFTLKTNDDATTNNNRDDRQRESLIRMDPVQLKVGVANDNEDGVKMKGVTATNEGDLVVIEFIKPENNNI